MPIKINGTNTAANPSITGSDTDTGIVYGSDQIDFSTGGTSRAAIDGSGHLKFTGTTEEITLQTSDGSDNGYLNLSGGGACSQNRAAQVVMYGNEVTDNQGKLLLMGGNSGNANGTVDFYSGGSKRMVIDSEGRVAISSTGTYFDTNTMLEVVGKTGAGPNLVLHRNDTTVSTNQVLAALRVTGNDNDGSTQQEAAAIEFAADGDHANNDKPCRIVFKTTADGGSSSSERMIINSSGFCGINSTDPKAQLQVNSDKNAETDRHDGSNYHLFLRNPQDDAGEAVGLAFSVTSNATKVGAAIMHEREGGGSQGSLQFYTNGDGNSTSKRMHIGSDGKTEITQSASSSTTSALHLFRPSAASNAAVDMIHFDSGGQGRGKLVSASSDAGSPALASRSDYRIKENIREYTGGWDNIKAVPVKLFDVKTDGSKDQKGWIAHELQAVLPDLVQGTKDAVDDNNDPIYQSVSMGLFMPDVVSALQTAIAKIETLETENDKLQTDLTALTARVAALEAA